MKKRNCPEYTEIDNIRNRHGDVIFRCAITHLVDVGQRNLLNDEVIAETIKQIRETTPPDSIMTADFQEEIVRCANSLAKSDIWDVLRYIKTDLEFSDWGGYGEWDDEEDEDDGYYI